MKNVLNYSFIHALSLDMGSFMVLVVEKMKINIIVFDLLVDIFWEAVYS